MNYKHGLSRSKLYQTYVNIQRRCRDPNKHNYYLYGGRGIICEWVNFESFYEWAIKNGYAENLTLDRIDSSKNYSSDNCRFVTNHVQVRNMKSNRWYTIKNETMILADWCRKYGIEYNTVSGRLKRGIDILTALTNKTRKQKLTEKFDN